MAAALLAECEAMHKGVGCESVDTELMN